MTKIIINKNDKGYYRVSKSNGVLVFTIEELRSYFLDNYGVIL